MKKICLCLIFVLVFTVGCTKTGRATDSENESSRPLTATEIMETEMTVTGSLEVPTEIMPEEQTVTADSPYYSSTAEFRITGFQQYDCLEGRWHTDTPEDGNCYLVLFLAVQNESPEDVFMDPDETSTTVDGIEISNTFLLNDPKGYPAIYNKLRPGGSRQGYIVWEVSKQWKELSVKFGQFQYTEHVLFNISLTPDDFLEAPEYLEDVY